MAPIERCATSQSCTRSPPVASVTHPTLPTSCATSRRGTPTTRAHRLTGWDRRTADLATDVIGTPNAVPSCHEAAHRRRRACCRPKRSSKGARTVRDGPRRARPGIGSAGSPAAHPGRYGRRRRPARRPAHRRRGSAPFRFGNESGASQGHSPHAPRGGLRRDASSAGSRARRRCRAKGLGRRWADHKSRES